MRARRPESDSLLPTRAASRNGRPALRHILYVIPEAPAVWQAPPPSDPIPGIDPAMVLEWNPMAPSRTGGQPQKPHASSNGTASPPKGRQVRPPRTGGPVITERDRSILQWIGRHGVVTPAQVTRHFFSRDDGSQGQWAAYRRLRKMEEIGLLQRDRTFWREAMVLRLTSQGARFADIDVRPANLVLAELRHTLAVVDLIEDLMDDLPKTTKLITERELRADRRRDLRLDPTKVATGRMPDAELQRAGKRIAVELDLTPKRSAAYEEILTSYIRQDYKEVWWYVSPRVVPRLRFIVKQNQADDFVSVQPWEG